MPVFGDMPLGSVLPVRASSGRRLAGVAMDVAAARCWLPRDGFLPALPQISSLVASLGWKRILCSSPISAAIMEMDKKKEKTKGMEDAVRAEVFHRWRSRLGYGARGGGRQPTSVASPSNLLAEGRPFLFLLAMMPIRRQCRCCSESAIHSSGDCRKWSCGDGGDPSGCVPGVVVVQSGQHLRTRLRFLISFGGPFRKLQGLLCNLSFLQGPFVKRAFKLI